MANVYAFNQGVKLKMTFDVDGALTDPDSISLSIEKPDGTVVAKTEADCVRESLGVWHYVQQGSLEGRWRWHAEGTGAATAAGDRHFTILPEFGG